MTFTQQSRTESEAHLYNFSHEYRLRLPCFAIKTIQMPSLGSKEALNVIFPGFRLNSFFSSSPVDAILSIFGISRDDVKIMGTDIST